MKTCKQNPQAPHGFDRDPFQTLDEYTCRCEHWKPEDLVIDTLYLVKYYLSDIVDYSTEDNLNEEIDLLKRVSNSIEALEFGDK